MKVIVVFVALMALVMVSGEKVKLENILPCSNMQIGAKIFEVNLNESKVYVDPLPCEGGTEYPHCKVARGSNIKLEVHFTANQNTTLVRQQITAELTGGLNLSFPGLKTSACKHGSIKCPVTRETPITYNVTIAVRPYYPTVTGLATVNLTGSEGTLFCFSFPVEVV